MISRCAGETVFGVVALWCLCACADEAEVPYTSTASGPGAPAQPLQTIVVEVAKLEVTGHAPRRILQSWVARKNGRAELSAGATKLALTVERVVKGPSNLLGHRLDTIFFGEAAHAVVTPRWPMAGAATDLSGYGGHWTLHRLPIEPANGHWWIVEEISDTPIPASQIRHRDALRTKILAGLQSDDPQFQSLALRSVAGHRFLEAVPHVIALLPSTEAVSPPWAEEREIGRLALVVLQHLVKPLADPEMPRRSRSEEAVQDWQRWWRRISLSAD